jgi:hypothetical protein
MAPHRARIGALVGALLASCGGGDQASSYYATRVLLSATSRA